MITRVALAFAAALTLAAPITLSADETKDEEVDPRGKPTTYKVGATARYAVWYDDAGWHLRVTTASKDPTEFVGVIEPVDGKISSISFLPSQGKKAGPALKTSTAKFNLTERINRGLEGGLDFKLDDSATGIKFELKIDGKATPETIFIGAKGGHPKAGVFSLPAKPARTTKKK